MGEVVSMRKKHLNCVGYSRARATPNSIVFTFNRTPSDAEMSFLVDVMARAAVMALIAAEKGKDQ